jgi:hypothetical protein
MSGVRSESPPRVPACHGGAALARAWGGGLESLDFQGLDATIRICKYLRGVGVQPASSGSWGSVVWAVDRRGRTAARKFFSELAQQDRAKIQSQFNILAEDGRIPTTERFKKLANRRNWPLWEFKSFQIRFIGTFSKRTSPGEFVVALGIRKKAIVIRIATLNGRYEFSMIISEKRSKLSNDIQESLAYENHRTPRE